MAQKIAKTTRNNKKEQEIKSGPEKGVITKGAFSLEESQESLKSLNSLESLRKKVGFSIVFHSLAVR